MPSLLVLSHAAPLTSLSPYPALAKIYVVDGVDRQRMEESGIELAALMEDERVAGLPLLLYVNKQDLFNCASGQEVADVLNLHITCRDRPCLPQECSAQLVDGVADGIAWLVNTLVKSRMLANPGKRR